MKYILILTFFLVCAFALPAYEAPIDHNDPQNYKNIEILILESAVDQDGGYSFSFENDDGSKVSQEGQQKVLDEEHAVERVKGSYSYTDVNGQPVSLTYTADENGFRPVGSHLPTPPPIPAEILRSLRLLATAQPFVDDQLYDYKPKKKVFRGRQYSTRNIPTRSRNNLRSNSFSQPLNDNSPREVFVKSAENHHDSNTETTSPTRSRNNLRSNSFYQPRNDNSPRQSAENHHDSNSETTSKRTTEATSETTQETTKTPAVQSAVEVVNESKKTINDALRESLEKTSNINKSATKETAADAAAAVREEASKLTDTVKLQISKIKDRLSGTSEEIKKEVSAPVKQSRRVIDKYATRFVSDVESVADETLADISTADEPQVDLNFSLNTHG